MMTTKNSYQLNFFSIIGITFCLFAPYQLSGTNLPRAITLGASGTIILSGDSTDNGPIPKIFLRSILPDGSPNILFTMAQESSAPNIEGWQTAQDVIALSDGSLVQAGAAYIGGNLAYLFAKTLSGGLSDTAFGISGVSQILQGQYSQANSLVDVPFATGIVGVGQAVVSGIPSISLILIDANAGTEIATEAVQIGYNPHLNSVVNASATAAIAAVGSVQLGSTVQGILTQYIVSPTSLVPDNNFGVNGLITSGDTVSTLYLDLDIDSNGNLIILGAQTCNPIVRKYTPTGILDTSFGMSGTLNISSLNLNLDSAVELSALKLQDDDSIVLVGGTTRQHLITLRVLPDGSALDPTFSASGVYLYDSNLASVATDLSINTTGSIFIAASVGCPENAIIKLNVSGLVALDFGTNGISSDLFTLLSPLVVLEEQEISGVSATGGFSAAIAVPLISTITRNLNNILPLGGNNKVQLNPSTREITIQPGTYLISAQAPAYSVLGHQLSFEDVTNNLNVALGNSVQLPPTSLLENTVSTLSSILTLASTTTFRLRHTARVASGFLDGILPNSAGAAVDLGLNELFSRLVVQELTPQCPLADDSQCPAKT